MFTAREGLKYKFTFEGNLFEPQHWSLKFKGRNGKGNWVRNEGYCMKNVVLK